MTEIKDRTVVGKLDACKQMMLDMESRTSDLKRELEQKRGVLAGLIAGIHQLDQEKIVIQGKLDKTALPSETGKLLIQRIQDDQNVLQKMVESNRTDLAKMDGLVMGLKLSIEGCQKLQERTLAEHDRNLRIAEEDAKDSEETAKKIKGRAK